MSARIKLTVLIVLAAGVTACGSSLKVKISRYSIEDTNAQAAYLKYHPAGPSAEERFAALVELQQEVAQYKAYVKTLNALALKLSNVPEQDKKIGEKDAAIDETFKNLESSLSAEQELLAKAVATNTSLPPPASPLLLKTWVSLPGALESRKIVVDPNNLETVIQQVSKLPNEALEQTAQSVRKDFEKLQRVVPAEVGETTVATALRTLEHTPTPDSVQRLAGAFSTAYWQAKQETGVAVSRVSGDLIKRTSSLYQEMTDPFLEYIGAHKNGWKDLSVTKEVQGDGDLEFIYVFEDNLDGRFKDISVDPSRVIQARLKIGRRAAQAAIAAGGVALNAFNVPMANIAGTGKVGQQQDVDYSRMTAAETIIRERNSSDRRLIEKLRKVARERGEAADADMAQRTLDMLKLELQAVPSATESTQAPTQATAL